MRRGVIPAEPAVRALRAGPLHQGRQRSEPRPATCCRISPRTSAAIRWAVCAFGPRETACALAAAALGGHVRVGFENNLWLVDGSLASSNADLVAQVAAGARLLGRPPADIATTRAFLAETAL